MKKILPQVEADSEKVKYLHKWKPALKYAGAPKYYLQYADGSTDQFEYEYHNFTDR